MNFAKELQGFFRWMAGIARNFLRRSPRHTILVVSVSALRGILQLLAFIIPLKVILLAATPGIPAYLPFVEPTHKDLWVVTLAFGAIAIYLVVQSIAPLLENWSLKTGQVLLRSANDLPVHADESAKAQKAFAELTKVFASVLFLSVGLIALIWLNPGLIYLLAFMSLVLFSVASIILNEGSDRLSPTRAKLIENPSKYIGIWEGCTFFGAFIIILLPFITTGDGNITFALISFILIRRMIAEFGGAIKISARLAKQRLTISALFYRNYKLRTTEQSSHQSFLQLFNKRTRDDVFSRVLGQVLGLDVSASTQWLDSKHRNVKWFRVDLKTKDDIQEYQFDAWVYDSASRFQADHAMFLFDHLAAEKLPRPAFTHRFGYEGYEVLLQETGSYVKLNPEQWKDLHIELVAELILTPLPNALIRSYQKTHPILPDLLTEQVFERLKVAVDNETEERVFREWMKIRPAVIDCLRKQPLVLINPDLNITHTVFDEETERWLHTFWGRWRIDVLSAALVHHGVFTNGEKFCSALQTRSNHQFGYSWAGDLKIGGLCQQLLTSVLSQRYKSAFDLMHLICEQWWSESHLDQQQPASAHP